MLATVELPTPYQPNKLEFQKQVVHRLERVRLAPRHGERGLPVVDDDGAWHPVEDDPALKHRLKAAAQAERVAAEIDDLRRGVKGRSQSIARRFDTVLRDPRVVGVRRRLVTHRERRG